MSNDFDPTPYVRPPVADVASGVALGGALLSAMPDDAPDNVRKAARRLREALTELKDAWTASGQVSPPGDKRPADVRVDKAWAALYARLDAYSSLPAQEYRKARRAAEIVDIIYPDGLHFLTLPYKAEWSEGEKRLKQIDEDDLADEVNDLAGPEFLAEVRKAHKLYGEAIGVMRPPGVNAPVNLVDPLRALGRAISQYSLQMIALADDTAESIELVRRALAPIDDHRAGAAQRAVRGDKLDPEAARSTPIPEIPQ